MLSIKSKRFARKRKRTIHPEYDLKIVLIFNKPLKLCNTAWNKNKKAGRLNKLSLIKERR